VSKGVMVKQFISVTRIRRALLVELLEAILDITNRDLPENFRG
jgi:hypothetical protein